MVYNKLFSKLRRKLCKSSWNCALNLAFPVFISPIVWNMCENLHYESVYFKELHNQQEYYWPTIYRTGAAVVSTITSVLLFGYNRIGVINQTPVNTFHVRWILSLSLTRLPVKQKIAEFSPSDSIQWHERLNCCRRSSVRSLNKISFTCRCIPFIVSPQPYQGNQFSTFIIHLSFKNYPVKVDRLLENVLDRNEGQMTKLNATFDALVATLTTTNMASDISPR